VLTLFSLLLFVAMAVSGASGFVIFWPLARRHQLDRDRESLTTPSGLAFVGWLLSGKYRERRDPALNGLATPALLLGWCTIIGIAGTIIVLLAKEYA
jgi:hypothetical protein